MTNTSRKQQAKTLSNSDSDSNGSRGSQSYPGMSQTPQQADDNTTYASQQTLNEMDTHRRHSLASIGGRSRKGSNPYIDEEARSELFDEVKESMRSGDLKVDGGEANPDKIPISLL